MMLSTNSSRFPQSQNILLVDYQELFRAGLRRMIEKTGCSSRVFEVGTGEESILVVRKHKIDMVFIDMVLPGLDGISTAVKLKEIQSSLKIVILTGSSVGCVRNALSASGLSGYMTKSSSAAEVAHVIHTVYSGKVYRSPELSAGFSGDTPGASDGGFDLLSQRELQVMLLVAQGYKTADVGRELQLNSRTISTYKRRAFTKLGVRNTAELVRHALHFGVLVTPL